ncbi:MAG: hypothetical protein ACRCZZ_05345, partial [Phocaeicola sp.]
GCESPYRVVDIDPSKGEMEIYSESLRITDEPIAGFREYAYKIAGQLSYLIEKIHVGKEVSQEIKDQVTKFGFDACISYFRGDEQLDSTKRAEIMDYAEKNPQVKAVLEEMIINGIYTDLNTPDRKIKFDYVKGVVLND